MGNSKALKLVVILSDGVREHEAQSRGVANWLCDLTGCEAVQYGIPRLKGIKRFIAKRMASSLPSGRKEEVASWLRFANGDKLLRSVGNLFARTGVGEGDSGVLLLSAGGFAACYCLALAALWKLPCSTVMTPSVGARPFEFAIVPEHEHPKPAPNILETIGFPTDIRKEQLKSKAAAFPPEHHPRSLKVWSVLIGGNDKNYKISPEWINKNVGRLIDLAEREDADLYIAASDKAGRDAVEALKELSAKNSAVRYLSVASEGSLDPIPAMLGLSDEVFCTEDSVGMVSEAITGGRRVILMRVGHKRKLAERLQKIAAALIARGALSQKAAFGTLRFDLLFERFKRHGRLIEFRDWTGGGADHPNGNLPDDGKIWADFNEARRAARWIAENWGK